MAPEQHSGGNELGRFLRARRTQTSPQAAGLTPGPGVRRTPGLRREELATLAGVKPDRLRTGQSRSAPMRRSHDRTSASALATSSPRTASPSPMVAPGQSAA
ncbi:hypothetical protein SAMN06272781_6449 [Streptomyces sp. 1222.2]|nr:hypothetical protein SAMN06272781_6449 [Streptomyces sp. 1222.2]